MPSVFRFGVSRNLYFARIATEIRDGAGPIRLPQLETQELRQRLLAHPKGLPLLNVVCESVPRLSSGRAALGIARSGAWS